MKPKNLVNFDEFQVFIRFNQKKYFVDPQKDYI